MSQYPNYQPPYPYAPPQSQHLPPPPGQYPPQPVYHGAAGQFYQQPGAPHNVAPSAAPQYGYPPPGANPHTAGVAMGASMGSPVALNPSFIAQRRTNVLIKPKKGSFNIDGHDAFKLKEHLFSSKTEFQTPQGQTLFVIRQHDFSSSRAFELTSESGMQLVKVHEHTFSSKMDATFRNAVAAHEEVVLEMKGHGVSEKTWDVVRKGGGKVARLEIHHGWSGGKYNLVVEAGCDLALMTALAYIVYKRLEKAKQAVDAAVDASGGGAGA